MRQQTVQPKTWTKPWIKRLGELKDVRGVNSGSQGGTKS